MFTVERSTFYAPLVSLARDYKRDDRDNEDAVFFALSAMVINWCLSFSTLGILGAKVAPTLPDRNGSAIA
jgi:hypothetical protein